MSDKSKKPRIAWKNDQELFPMIKEHLFSAVIGDIIDKFGYLNQCLPTEIWPFRCNMIVTGCGMKALKADVYESEIDNDVISVVLEKALGERTV